MTEKKDMRDDMCIYLCRKTSANMHRCMTYPYYEQQQQRIQYSSSRRIERCWKLMIMKQTVKERI